MVERWIIAGLLAGCWGFIWAAVLQFSKWGQWAAIKRTWITVVIGTGGTLLLTAIALDWVSFLGLWAVFGMSSIGIIARSQYKEWKEDR